MARMFVKDPDETLNYTIDAKGTNGINDGTVNDNGWLQGATLTSATVSVPVGLTKVSSNNDTTTAWVFISGGTLGSTYRVTFQLNTSNGLTKDASFFLRIKHR